MAIPCSIILLKWKCLQIPDISSIWIIDKHDRDLLRPLHIQNSLWLIQYKLYCLSNSNLIQGERQRCQQYFIYGSCREPFGWSNCWHTKERTKYWIRLWRNCSKVSYITIIIVWQKCYKIIKWPLDNNSRSLLWIRAWYRKGCRHTNGRSFNGFRRTYGIPGSKCSRKFEAR